MHSRFQHLRKDSDCLIVQDLLVEDSLNDLFGRVDVVVPIIGHKFCSWINQYI